MLMGYGIIGKIGCHVIGTLEKQHLRLLFFTMLHYQIAKASIPGKAVAMLQV